MQKNIIFSLFFIILLGSCQNKNKLPQLADEEQFVKYWFSGNAEVNTYALDQAQYSAINKGEVIMAFVTEDFRLDKQVKFNSEVPKGRAASVMKLNNIRRFKTGVYDYSSMTSVFMPISVNDFSHALKINCSVQDWCGQSFRQLNFRQNGYQVVGHSYFENFVEENFHINKGVSEDELFSAIRLKPDKLELGDKMMIPSLFSARMRQSKIVPILANLKLYEYKESNFKGQKLRVYEIDYKGDARNLKIVFENIFPYRIVGFEETYKQKDVFMTSRAKLKKSILMPYWSQNQPADSIKRKELEIESFGR